MMGDKCIDCGNPVYKDEANYSSWLEFKKKNPALSLPKRCSECRDKKRQRNQKK